MGKEDLWRYRDSQTENLPKVYFFDPEEKKRISFPRGDYSWWEGFLLVVFIAILLAMLSPFWLIEKAKSAFLRVGEFFALHPVG